MGNSIPLGIDGTTFQGRTPLRAGVTLFDSSPASLFGTGGRVQSLDVQRQAAGSSLSYTVPANTLSTDDAWIEFFALVNTTGLVTVSFGGTTLYSQTPGTGERVLHGVIFRKGSSSQQCAVCVRATDSFPCVDTASTVDLTASASLIVTATSGVCSMLFTDLYGAPAVGASLIPVGRRLVGGAGLVALDSGDTLVNESGGAAFASTGGPVTTLYSLAPSFTSTEDYTVPADTLSADGDRLLVIGSVDRSVSVNRLLFGGSTVFSESTGSNRRMLRSMIIRVGSSSQRCITTDMTVNGNFGTSETSLAVDLTSDQTLRLQSLNAGITLYLVKKVAA